MTPKDDEVNEKSESRFEVRVEREVAYLPAGRAERLDLYLPVAAGAGRWPAVVLIHGGGWAKLDKAKPREVAIATVLAGAGYVVASIDYKLTTPAEKGWPTNLRDCKTAVRFLRQRADEYRIDAGRIAVMGSSAGGHLAMLVGYTSGSGEGEVQCPYYPEQSDAVSAVVDLYGPSDARRVLAKRYTTLCGECFLPPLSAANARQYELASPVCWAKSQGPPVLVIHGTADEIVDIDHSEKLVEALRHAGVTHEFVRVEGAAHSFDLTPPQQDLRPTVLAFLAKHLGGAGGV